MQNSVHIPVMLGEVLSAMAPRPKCIYVDMTVGAGGHAAALLEKSPGGHLIGIDRDETVLSAADSRLKATGERYTLHCGRYSQVDSLLQRLHIAHVDGIFFDLGVSSLQLDQASRGFSFSKEGPLDMRMGRDCPRIAEEILAKFSEKELARIFWEYGEEKRARKIASAIVKVRQKRHLKSTLELANLIATICGPKGRIHPATRIFQALRIAVNDELGELAAGLKNALPYLTPGGRVAVVSFHSLEDRIVKQFFRSQKELKIITPKPLRPLEEEIRQNPRSRSARLRCAAREN